ncbi:MULTISPECIES: hypothetical protein [Microbacterium]|uniref:hypothetical protein n=1 Tax=Microbacterium TaxID=33882 RepID=UPI00278791BE|nr:MULTISPECIES: hypothetical protein [Microbacterium]MDQ1082292.1 hypothetical protein [Microbacterium sp. SORGH_AS_0344]MDQ1168936.1 hypothetical protein [Microbacterium proteolyticum]
MPQMHAPRTVRTDSTRSAPALDTDRPERAESVRTVGIDAPPTRTPVGREGEREHREAVAFFRGALVASAVVAPFWAAVAIVAWLVTR